VALVPSSYILVTLIMEAIRYSEATATRRHIPADGILQKSFRLQFLECYVSSLLLPVRSAVMLPAVLAPAVTLYDCIILHCTACSRSFTS
jgi:hypothetical protein